MSASGGVPLRNQGKISTTALGKIQPVSLPVYFLSVLSIQDLTQSNFPVAT
jgi:hypothetical protein